MASTPEDIAVDCATAEDLPRIENLMQFYNYELSEWYPINFAPHGLYELRPKQAYWSRPTVVPYTLRVEGQLAGFCVVDDEVLDGATQFNMGYFFVARRYRGLGLGLHFARSVINRHPGRWEVYHLERNAAAKRFWSKAIEHITGTPASARSEVIDDWPAVLFAFMAAAPEV